MVNRRCIGRCGWQVAEQEAYAHVKEAPVKGVRPRRAKGVMPLAYEFQLTHKGRYSLLVVN